MTCKHVRKTLIAVAHTAGRTYKTWHCEDCMATVNEQVDTPDTLYTCHGDCAGCHMPIEEGKSCDKG